MFPNDTIDVQADLDLDLVLLVLVLHAIEPLHQHRALVVDRDIDSAVREVQLIAGLQEPNRLNEGYSRSIATETGEAHLSQLIDRVLPEQGWSTVEVTEEVDYSPSDEPVAALFTANQPVQVGIVPHP